VAPYRTTGAILAGALTVAGIGAFWQAIADRRDRRRFPPPGELVEVGDHRLHLVVSGEPSEAPTVVLEAGMASMSANWAWVRQELANNRRVVSYDRAGLGWSDRATGPVDAATSAADLHSALERSGIAPPYVLAGHSYGGLVVRMFADRYPGEVAGLVLVDSSHPDQWANIPASREGRTVALGNRMTALSARVGLLRLLHTERPFIAGLPAREYAEMRAYSSPGPGPHALR
jgi:pimeloyl-ACP methyl ester carboxylesterase